MEKLTKEQLLARFEMFEEAANHLDGSVTEDRNEQEQISYVQKVIRKHAQKWLEKWRSRKY